MKKIKVLIVDDSALIRKVLSTLLDADPEIDVVGTAGDPFIARDKIKKLKPDVLTLDVEMPRMNGIDFLRNLMRLHPMPVIMVSTLTEEKAEITIEALSIGAFDYMVKPKSDLAHGFDQYATELIDKIKAAAESNLTKLATKSASDTDENRILSWEHYKPDSKAIITIGSSTGGLEALGAVFSDLPAKGPPIVIAQHIPPGFSKSFAKRQNQLLENIEFFEAYDGQSLEPGAAYIAPGDQHMEIRFHQDHYFVNLTSTEPVNRHRPSVEVLFNSVAKYAKGQVIGVMLTGMGADGVNGMAELQKAGAYTIAQDQATSVVWGMPGACVKAGVIDEVCALHEISARLTRLIGK